MNNKIFISLIFTLVLVNSKTTKPIGSWTNALGSILFIVEISNMDSSMSGGYISNVGNVSRSNALIGYYYNNLMGWTVIWNSMSPSMTVWVGQYFYPDTIVTMWLLSTQVNQTQDRWQSTITGSDVFTRVG